MGIPSPASCTTSSSKPSFSRARAKRRKSTRRAARNLLAKSKTGKTTAKRKLAKRMRNSRSASRKVYRSGHVPREMLCLSRDRFDILRSELWETDSRHFLTPAGAALLSKHRLLLQLPQACAYFRCAARTVIPTSSRTFTSGGGPTKSCGCCPTKPRNQLLKGDQTPSCPFCPLPKPPPDRTLADLTV